MELMPISQLRTWASYLALVQEAMPDGASQGRQETHWRDIKGFFGTFVRS